MAPRRSGRPLPHRVRGNNHSGMTQGGNNIPPNNQHHQKSGPSYEAGLFDQLDEDFFSISAEDGDIELQEDNVDNNTSERIAAASEASDAAAVFYVTTENAAAMIGQDDNVPMKGDDDAATKASE